MATQTEQQRRGLIRQGDVLLIPRAEPKLKSRATDGDGRPLAGVRIAGERTGHAHVLPARVYDTPDGERVMLLERPTPLVHPEHGDLPVPAGWWEVRQQREYLPSPAPRHAGRTAARYD